MDIFFIFFDVFLFIRDFMGRIVVSFYGKFELRFLFNGFISVCDYCSIEIKGFGK